MKITILNGNPGAQNAKLDAYIVSLNTWLSAKQHRVKALTLREMNLKFCTGCFGCWVKTPGQCVVHDASHDIGRAIINSDFLLWAAPLRMGFPSATLKKALDKSIPLVHPYFVVDHGEAHHRPRYDRYPRVGLLLQKEADTDDEDLRIVGDILSRTALNMKSKLEFAATTDQHVREVALAIIEGTETGVPFDRDPAPIPGTRITPPARLTVFNGSPRGPKGNSPLMLEQVVKGLTSDGTHTAETCHLVHQNALDDYRDAFAAAEAVLLGFPLYTDAMPAIVKTFIEALEPLRGRNGNPPIGFLVQSGFPEAVHSRHLERYLAKLAERLGSPYLGTIVKGGGEGTRLMPESMNRKLFDNLSAIGHSLAAEGRFDAASMRAIAKPERYPGFLAPAFEMLSKTPLLNRYWNNQLKANGVYEERFAQPFAE